MKQQQNRLALIQAILSIVFGLIVWLYFAIGLTVPIVGLSDFVQLLLVPITASLAIPGAIMAILAKKNNTSNKMSVVYISAIGIIISAVDILLFPIIVPIAFSATLYHINIWGTIYFYIPVTVGVIIDIILVSNYYRAKPKIQK